MALLLFGTERVTAQALSASLTPSDHNGFAVSCFGESDGSITANVSGGTPPYAYAWSHGDSVAQVSNLPAGYYKLIVLDSDTGRLEVDITLMQPPGLKVNLTPSLYPNDYNISCWNCFNGSLQTAVTGGVAPYQYEWNDGAVTSSRTGLGHKFGYMVVVSDGNGCMVQSERLSLTQPDQEGWLKGGNSGTDAQTDFIGTADTSDLVLKTNGVERIRFTGDGDLKFIGLGEGLLSIDENGQAGSMAFSKPWCFDADPTISPWYLCGNEISSTVHFLGTVNEQPLKIKTHGVERMRITETGHVQIGGALDEWPIGSVEARVGIQQGANGNWLALHDRLSPPGTPSGFWGIRNHAAGDRLNINFHQPAGDIVWDVLTLYQNGKVGIGDVSTNTPDHDYRLYVQGGVLTERVKVAIRTSTEWSDHVFLPGYRLMPLAEVECFIQENGHLPGLPSADQMVEQGLDVVKTDALLLEKIEEITLHLVHMNSRIIKLEHENEQLRKNHTTH